MMGLLNPILFLMTTIVVPFLVFKFLSKTSILYIFRSWFRVLSDKCYVYQFYRVPQFNDHMQENQLYRKVQAYLNSLPAAVEDSDFTNLFSGKKPNEIKIVLDPTQVVVDNFLGARLYWSQESPPPVPADTGSTRSMVLKIRKSDKRRVLQPYLQHIHTVFEQLEQRKEVQLYINVEDHPLRNGRWRSVPFGHPATIDSVVMDADLKTKVKSDLESFLKSRQYYHRLGRVWKRSYLLYGASGTGKSTFIAAMAKFLNYDVYDVDLSKVSDDSDLKSLLLQTTSKSLIVMEDLERFLLGKSTTNVSLPGILQFMDGIVSCCGEERVMVFSMNVKDHIDPTVLRPGRIDVHLHFPLCDFNAFKSMASTHLGLKDHKLFPQVEEMFQTGATLSPAEIGEIMISNRGSPSRALKSVLSALQNNAEAKVGSKIARRLSHNSDSGSIRVVEESVSGDSGMFCKEGGVGVHTAKEFRKLYGFLRRSRKGGDSMDFEEKENGS
ncbi:OLC1v1020902C1 [Oldenlandia corymbosa var. corymbosa]|uniref:OLC1v1020902C1 n=1 Tax=Oldenlandia corymbosa var. corymbosa TaxID=529605 RepID=A0AAV1BVP7_OLDCO|nr:OLC1v1020902C1 [Oldenlandia corymbosa var. corymbosa]